jgi:hypothetical protein
MRVYPVTENRVWLYDCDHCKVTCHTKVLRRTGAVFNRPWRIEGRTAGPDEVVCTGCVKTTRITDPHLFLGGNNNENDPQRF